LIIDQFLRTDALFFVVWFYFVTFRIVTPTLKDKPLYSEHIVAL